MERWKASAGSLVSGQAIGSGQHARPRPRTCHTSTRGGKRRLWPPPAGGWPHLDWEHADHNLAYDLGDLTDSGAAVGVTTFRPSENQAVLVVAAANREAVEAQLRPQLGNLLCVVTSRWTRPDLDAVRAHMRARWEDWNLYELGESSRQDGQAYLAAKLTRVRPEIADWATSLPPGILTLDPGSAAQSHNPPGR